ncbi:hypothetical protein AGLY_009825 [Aphis glycines]|uniref:Uncharacterized protein n=1 Tax=Aphis glycines TaxID=307491 RepID=A0A6G0TGY1_APHGL|nr:hypothetical protein AGLY_009825 [Aphis glycines]
MKFFKTDYKILSRKKVNHLCLHHFINIKCVLVLRSTHQNLSGDRQYDIHTDVNYLNIIVWLIGFRMSFCAANSLNYFHSFGNSSKYSVGNKCDKKLTTISLSCFKCERISSSNSPPHILSPPNPVPKMKFSTVFWHSLNNATWISPKTVCKAASVEDIISSFEGLSLNTSRSASILLISSGSRLQKKNVGSLIEASNAGFVAASISNVTAAFSFPIILTNVLLNMLTTFTPNMVG